MEFEKSKSRTNPWTNANFFSRLLFCWLTPLLIKARKGNLKLNDLYDCPTVDTSEKNGNRLQKQWEKELKKLKSGGQPSLLRATIRAFGVEYYPTFVLILIQECFVWISQSILLGYMIRHFARTEVLPKTYIYLISAAFCLLSFIEPVLNHPALFKSQRMTMKLRTACCNLVYKKAMKLSQASLGKTTVGQMVNLLSNDVSRFDQIGNFLPFLFAAPLQAIIIAFVLWLYVGYATFATVCVLLLFIPLQTAMGKSFSKLRSKAAILTDERIRLMNEIIGAMRVIKMYGWEIHFAKLVALSRRNEMKKIRRISFLRGINTAISFISSRVIFLMTIVAFLLIVDGDMTPEIVFVCMSLVGNMDRTLTFCFPIIIGSGAECLISLKRIQRFLLLEEQSETYLLDVSNLRPKIEHCGIWMKKVNASWNKDGEDTLRDLTLTVKPGELLVVVGPVGCGKSSLLMSILGELPITSGDMKIRGQLSYASQEPWIFSGSIKENIIFGSDFDEAKYKKILSVCALQTDIEQLPYGDQTAVGERGVILSGGQKARVNLARAMYFDADIFLLDDPLSAVDTCVSNHLFDQCINDYSKDKIRILATHQVQFLRHATQILVLEEGECAALGRYDDLIKEGVDFGSLMEDYKQERRKRSSCLSDRLLIESVFDKYKKEQRKRSSCLSDRLIIESVLDKCKEESLNESTLSLNSDVIDGYEDICETVENIPSVDEETKGFGSVSNKVYKEYFLTGPGTFVTVLVVILYIITQAVYNSGDFWLAAWTDLDQTKDNIKQCWMDLNKTYLRDAGFYNDSNGNFGHNLFRKTIANVSDDCFAITQNYTRDVYDARKDVSMNFRLSVYAWLVIGAFLLSLLRTSVFHEMCMKTSVSLHDKMFQSVSRSPVEFFDRNPVGRVLNRFSKDTGIIDDLLPYTASETMRILFHALGVVCVVAVIEPYLLLSTAVVGMLVMVFRKIYVPTVRDVKRYEGITRSPVFSHLSTSLYGLTTIRAFKAQRAFEINFDHYQDQHSGPWFLFLSLIRWLAIILDFLCAAYITTVTVAMVILAEDPSYASTAGLAMTSALQLLTLFQYSVRQSAEVESLMTSVERVIEYSNLESEAPLDSKYEKKPPHNWPTKGCIIYCNVSLKYTPDEPPVLKNLNFMIYPKEKIGIVGRTGAGKSSMIATLFRMNEPEGDILIDGFCTKEIGLHDLRKKISIIPQDPTLFTGPVRRNLDPFDEHSDEEMWKVLEEVYLKPYIEEMAGGLDTEVTEGGCNFSVGQRQLVCLARALLRKNRILVLDEATANVDPNTDKLIQKTIRDRFEDCTVLTVAHRLHTIMDSDRVLVFEAGEVKEFDEPNNLLKKPHGILTQMTQNTGPAMEKKLHEIAHSAHLKKREKREKGLEMSWHFKWQ